MTGEPGTSADSGDPGMYVVCTSCGYFYGDCRRLSVLAVECPECDSEIASVFSKVDRALEASARIKDDNRGRRPDASWGT